MYYRLNENLRMCGWDYLETGLVEVRSNQVSFMQPEMYQLLSICNGTTDADKMSLTEEQKKMLGDLAEKNIIVASEEELPPLEKWQEYRRYNNRLIKSAHWSITGKCNYKCRHCYMSAPCGILGELSYEDCKKIIDQMEEVGLLSVSLTGGEAMVHPHFWDIVDLLIEKHIRISEVYSNGFLINEKFFKNCEERGIKPTISLSFDGLGGAHEWLRGVTGADDHIRNAIRLINEHGFRYNVEMCLFRKSADTLRESVRFLNDQKCVSLKINALSVVGEGLQIKDQVIDRDEYYKLFMDYVPFYKEDAITMPIFACSVYLTNKGIHLVADKHVSEEKASNYCLCGHARTSMYVSCTGAILPCIPYSEDPALEKDFPNVLETPLREIFVKSKYFDVITKTLTEFLEQHPKCAECKYKYACVGGCPGRAAMSSKLTDNDEVDEEMCWYYTNGLHEQFKELNARVFPA